MDEALNRINFIQLMMQKQPLLEGIHKDIQDFKQRLIEIEYLELKSFRK